jgi:hypothetical protein
MVATQACTLGSRVSDHTGSLGDGADAATVIAIWTKIRDAWPFRGLVNRRSLAIVSDSGA